MTDYNGIDSGEVYISSLGDLGRDPKTILINYVLEASKKANHISKVYRKVLEAMILRFQRLSYLDSELEEISLKCFHANPERAIAKLNQENNIILPVLSLSQSYSDSDPNRVRSKNLLVTKTVKNAKLNKVERLVTLAPKPVNIIYSFNVWSKYMSDLDQITEQVRGEFNPHIDLTTDLGTVKVFLTREDNNSEITVGDGSDRVLRKSFTLEVEAYIPYPEFLLTSNGRITEFNTEFHRIIDPPISKPADFSDEANARPPQDPGTFPGTTSPSGITSDPVDLELYYMIPEFGPWYIERTFAINGVGFQNDNAVTVGGVPVKSTLLLDEYNLLAQAQAFSESDAGTSKTLNVQDTDTGDSYRLVDAFEISPLPQVTNVASAVVAGDTIFDPSSVEIYLSGTNFDSYLQPYYASPSNRSNIYFNDTAITTTIISDTELSGFIDITEEFSNRTVDVTVSNYNGSTTSDDLITIPEAVTYNPAEILGLSSIEPTFGPFASSLSIEVSGTGFLEPSSISVTMKGFDASVVSSPTLSGLTILTPEFAASDIGTSADVTVTVSGALVQTSSLSDAFLVSPSPSISTVSSTTIYSGDVPVSANLYVTGLNLSAYIDPYYSSDGNRTKLSISNDSYTGSDITLSTVIISDTEVSSVVPINSDMYSLDFDVTVSNINGSGTEGSSLAIEGPVSSTPLLYLEPSTISEPLIQAVVPIEPVAVDSIPALYIDGSACDVFPVSYTWDDKIDVVQVVGPTSGGGTSYLENTGSTELPGSDIYNTLDISDVRFIMDLSSKTVDMSAGMFSNVIDTLRDGVRIKEEVFHSLITDYELEPDDEEYTCGNITSFVTRRSDTSGLDVWLLIANDNYDLSKDPRVGGIEHPEIAGEVWFNSMKIENLPSGYRLYSEFDDPSMNTSAGWVIQPVDNGSGGYYEQLFPARQRIIRHYVIGPDTAAGAAEAEEILAKKDYCEVRSGDNSYYNLSGYGAQRDYLPKINDNFQLNYNPVYSGSGWEVMDYRCSTLFEALKSAAENGTSDSQVQFLRDWGVNVNGVGETTSNMTSGYYHPYGIPSSRTSGGVLVHTRHGWQNNRWLWKSSEIQMTYQVQRHDSSITDITGAIVTASAMAESNPESTTSDKYMPWSLGFGIDQPQYWWPWYSYESTTGSQLDRCLAPTFKPWNSPQDVTNTLYYDADPTIYSNSYDCIRNFRNPGYAKFGPYEGDHSSRFNQTTQPLVWSCNLGIAKWIVLQEASHAESILCPYEVKNSLYTGTANGPNDYQSNHFNLHELLKNIGENNIQWGRRIANIYPSMQRGWGNYINMLSEGMRITSPSNYRRTEFRSWSNQFALLYHLYASNVGTVGDRSGSYASYNFGTYDGTNASGTPPTEYDVDQLYMTSLFSHGLLGALQAFFGLTGVVSDSFKRTLEILPYYLWKYADDNGFRYAQGLVLHSNTLNSTIDPPPTTVVGWDFNSGFVAGPNPIAQMDDSNILYTAFLVSDNVKFKEWFFKIMTECFLDDSGNYKGSVSLNGIDSVTGATFKEPTTNQEAIDLFNKIAGDAQSGVGYEVQRTWAAFAAPFIGLLSHTEGTAQDDPNIPTSLY